MFHQAENSGSNQDDLIRLFWMIPAIFIWHKSESLPESWIHVDLGLVAFVHVHYFKTNVLAIRRSVTDSETEPYTVINCNIVPLTRLVD